MNISNSQIRARARYLLDDNIFGKDWLKSTLVSLLTFAVIGLTGGVLFFLSNTYINPIIEQLVGDKSVILKYGLPLILDLIEILLLCLLIGPVSVGMASVHLDLVRGEGRVQIHKFFYGFKDFVSNFVLGCMYVLQVFIWGLIFIIPGIYVSYSYALVFHIRKDHPEYRWKQCFDESERIMEGKRWDLFKLQMSHIGWLVVGIVFVFVGAFWAVPYLQTSTAIFYEQAKRSK